MEEKMLLEIGDYEIRYSEVFLKYSENGEMEEIRKICRSVYDRYEKALASEATPAGASIAGTIPKTQHIQYSTDPAEKIV